MQKGIFFIHVPKCGGTSVRAAIRELYRPDEEAGPSDQPAYARLDAAASVQAAEMLGRSYHEVRDDLLLYFMATRGTRFVAGHFRFSEVAYTRFRERFAFVTLLRDPVAHFLSQYFYNRYKTRDHARVTLDLAAFLQTDEARGYGCQYVTMLAGPCGVRDHASPEAVRVAQRHVDELDVAGTLESLDRFAADFEAAFGAKLHLSHLNGNPRADYRESTEIDEGVLRRVREICRPNALVYEHLRNSRT